MTKKIISCLFGLLAVAGPHLHATPLDTAFTYQGRLDQNGQPAPNGIYQMTFTLFDQATSGTARGTNPGLLVPVTNGLFTTDLDFGATAFGGQARWLEIAVRTNDNALPFDLLTPRVRIAPTPNAIYASTAGSANTVATGAIQSTQLATVGAPPTSGQVLTYNGSSLAWQSVAINGAWATNGNNAVAGSFLGTINNVPLDLRANNVRLLRLDPNPNGPNSIGGASGNYVAPGVEGATIAGGGTQTRFGGAYTNGINADYGTVGGGLGNRISQIAYDCVISGGRENIIHSNAFRSSIGGGIQNFIGTNCNSSTIAGGNNNSCGSNAAFVGGGTINHANGSSSTLAGGYDNTVTGDVAFIGGGARNRCSGSFSSIAGGENNSTAADYASISGGSANLASGEQSFIGGGGNNQAAGPGAAAVGGFANVAQGANSFAAGTKARALHDNSFVWADFQADPTFPALPLAYESTAPNQFSVRASGGVRFETPFFQISGSGAHQHTGVLQVGSPSDSSGVVGYGQWAIQGAGSNVGVAGYSDRVGVQGVSSFGCAVEGLTRAMGIVGNGAIAICGDTQGATEDWAGYFKGKVRITTDLYVSGSKNFKIDHPLDPANKYLRHSCVESPDVKNIYDGMITTDDAGEAIVTLPTYFEALNRDFRYQLTVLGQFAQAIVSSKIQNNQFTIRTDRPGVEVSWQVTGIRQDAYIKAHPMVVEEDKPAKERGFYQHPELFGQPGEKGLEWGRDRGLRQRAEAERARQEVLAAH